MTKVYNFGPVLYYNMPTSANIYSTASFFSSTQMLDKMLDSTLKH